MRVLIVIAHPEGESFNAGLKNVALDTFRGAGHSVEISDLYAEGFDPVEGPVHYKCRSDGKVFDTLSEQRNAWKTGSVPADVEKEIARLENADLVVLQFPMWWHGPPAILKDGLTAFLLAEGCIPAKCVTTRDILGVNAPFSQSQ